MSSKKCHTGFRNGNLFCYNCGDSHQIIMPISVDEMSKEMKAFDERHSNCPKTWEEPKPSMNLSLLQRVDWWYKYAEKGLSSECMFYHFAKKLLPDSNYAKMEAYTNNPHDPDDFKRCYNLLQVIPEWKKHINIMKDLSREWSNLVDHWDTLTKMYETNDLDMYKRMQQVLKQKQ